ncbi:MAG: BrnT family toxin [Selenomonadaceae bacterium]|nr:BrnT family toxin [Selenomonadaceae bacterium]
MSEFWSKDVQKFEWDPNKDRINKKKHNISFELAKRVFADENRVVLPDIEHSNIEDRYITIGMANELLFVVYTIRHGDTIRIISARLATMEEKGFYYASNFIS